jgi:hypothetical protein
MSIGCAPKPARRWVGVEARAAGAMTAAEVSDQSLLPTGSRAAVKIFKTVASDSVDSTEILMQVPIGDELKPANSFKGTKGMSHIRVYPRAPCFAGLCISRFPYALDLKQVRIGLRPAPRAARPSTPSPHV